MSVLRLAWASAITSPPRPDGAGAAMAAGQIDLRLIEKLHRNSPSATKKGNGPAVPLTRCRGEGAGCAASVHRRLDRNEGASARRALEAHRAAGRREDRMVLAHADVG